MNARLKVGIVVAGTFSIMCGIPTKADAQPADLKIKKNAAFKHEHSKIKMPAVLTGYKRDFAKTYFPNELDISFQYASTDERNFISIYIYRNTNGNASIWFDRAKYPIETRDVYGTVTVDQLPRAFAPIGLKNASAMRVSYLTSGSNYKATGLMLIPVNGWYVKIRATSHDRDPAAIDKWMDQALEEIQFPTPVNESPEAYSIKTCKDELFFKGDAKPVEDSEDSSMVSGLFGAVAAGLVEKGAATTVSERIIWCREDKPKLLPSAVYRANGSANSYLYALGDSGRAVTTRPAGLGGFIVVDPKEGDSAATDYSVTLHIPDRNLTFRERNQMPSPDEALKVVQTEKATSATRIFGQKPGSITVFTNGDK